MQINFRLQAFCAMRRSVFIITIQNFFFRDLKKLREVHRHQLSRRVEKDVSFDKLSSSSKQLIIKSFIEK